MFETRNKPYTTTFYAIKKKKPVNLKLTIISILICANLIGQNSLKKVDLNENYTFEKYSQEELNEYYFGIKPIKFSKIKYHFRFIQYGQIIDLESNNGIEFSIVSFIFL